MDYLKISNITFEDIDHTDVPDYCDVFISNADYNCVPMTDVQLDKINEDSQFVYEKLISHIH